MIIEIVEDQSEYLPTYLGHCFAVGTRHEVAVFFPDCGEVVVDTSDFTLLLHPNEYKVVDAL